jgi:hypothetical protein
MNGGKTCYHHGGSSPKGYNHPSTTHGRYSKDVPTQLAEKYTEAASDEDLLNLGSEIALIDSRIREQLGRVGSGAIGHIWGEVGRVSKELSLAVQAQDAEWMRRLFLELDELSRKGNADYAGWRDIIGLVEQRRKLVESERKRRVDMQQNITAERAMLLVSAIVGVIRDNVTDRAVLASIQRDVGKLITIDSS